MSRWNVFNRFKSGANNAEAEKGLDAAPQDDTAPGGLSDGDGTPESREHVQFTYGKVVWTDEGEGSPDDLTGDQFGPSGAPAGGEATDAISYSGLESEGESLDELAQGATDAAGNPTPYYQWELRRVPAEDKSPTAPTGVKTNDQGEEPSDAGHKVLPVDDTEVAPSGLEESTDDSGGVDGGPFERAWPSKWEGPQSNATGDGDGDADGHDFLTWQRGIPPADGDESLALNYSKVEADKPSPVAPNDFADDTGDTGADGLSLPLVPEGDGDGIPDIVTGAGAGGGPHAPPDSPSPESLAGNDDADASGWPAKWYVPELESDANAAGDGVRTYNLEQAWPKKTEGPAAEPPESEGVKADPSEQSQAGSMASHMQEAGHDTVDVPTDPPAHSSSGVELNYYKVQADEPSPLEPGSSPQDMTADDSDPDTAMLLPAVQKVANDIPADKSGAEDHKSWIEVDSFSHGAAPSEGADSSVLGNAGTQSDDAPEFPKVEYSDEPSTLLPVSEETEATHDASSSEPNDESGASLSDGDGVPAGSTDHDGRVKVQFHFDREGQDDVGPGATSEPGDDAVVGFEHGDIAKPYVIGGMWNGDDSPPPTGAAGGGGSNEMAMEDDAGTQSMPGPPAPGTPTPLPNISKSTDTPTAGDPDQPVVVGRMPNTDSDVLQPEETDLEFLQSPASQGDSLPGLDKAEEAELEAEGNDVAMESLTLQHEGLEVEGGEKAEVWGFEDKVDSPPDAEAPPAGTTQTAGDLTQMPGLTLQDTMEDQDHETYDYPGEYAQRFDGVDDEPSTLLPLEETADGKTIIGGFKSVAGMDSETEVIEFEDDDDGFEDMDLS